MALAKENKEELPVKESTSPQLVVLKQDRWGLTFTELQNAYCMPLKENMDVVKSGLIHKMYLICNF